jgi:hypothetical protein
MKPTSGQVSTFLPARAYSPSFGITVIRWTARILGVLIAGFFLVMFIGESWQSHSWGSLLHLNPVDAVLLTMMGLYAVGMVIAIMWERTGSLLSFGALGMFFLLFGVRTALQHGLRAAFSPGYRGVLNPFLLMFWLPVILYLLCVVADARKPAKA